jgi:hypothetical protein
VAKAPEGEAAPVPEGNEVVKNVSAAF